MGISIATLQQHIHERRERLAHIESMELGQGVSIVAERSLLFLRSIHEPTEQALCGFIEDTPRGPRWTLYREWQVELKNTFGELPANLVIEGDSE